VVSSPQPQRAINQTQLPSSRLASFTNQAIGGLSAGLTGATGPVSADDIAARNVKKPESAVQLSAQKRGQGVLDSGKRLTQLAQVGAQKRAARQVAMMQQPRGGGGVAVGGPGYNGNPVGQAWQKNGSLSGSRNRVMSLASSYLGTPYVLGGTSYKGIDCSGLVMMVYNQLGYKISSHSATWQGRNIPGVRTSLNKLRPGDIVAWKDGSHIAIYAGNGEIIEAANPRRGTLRRRLWANPNAVFGIALRLPGE
jgi:cell wall-associated NlpC family hydrolase